MPSEIPMELKAKALEMLKTTDLNTVSRELNITRRTLRLWANENDIPISDPPRHEYYYSSEFKKEVLAFYNEHGFKATLEQYPMSRNALNLWIKGAKTQPTTAQIYMRPAQIPITGERYHYLTESYSPVENNDWTMVHHQYEPCFEYKSQIAHMCRQEGEPPLQIGHFIIYSKETKHRVFDATYMKREPEHQDSITAVVFEIEINPNSVHGSHDDSYFFSTFADLIDRDL